MDGSSKAVDTPIGRLPAPGELDISGLELAPGALDELLKIDLDDWRAELPSIGEHFGTFGDRLPRVLRDELTRLQERLG
jgi:phosphoenolpyruvate carboxykinase (GTP)